MEEEAIEGIMGVGILIIEGEEVDEIDGTITTVTATTAHVKNLLGVEALIPTESVVHQQYRMVIRRTTQKKRKASEYRSAHPPSIFIR